MELGQRQTPERFVFRRRAGQQASGQLVVEAEQGVIVVTQGSFRRAGQGRHVDNQLRLLRRGVDQAIGQHQTAFGIGVHHLNIFTVAVANDVAQLEGVATHHVIRAAQVELHALVQTTGDGERQRAGNGRRAAHVGLHGIHERALLQAVTAGIEGDTFPDQTGKDRRFFIAGWVVIQRQQDRRTLGATTHGVDTHVILFAQVFTFGDAVGHLVVRHAAQQVNRALRQLLRPQLFRRGVDGVAHPVDNFQAAFQLFLTGFIEVRPLNFTGAFRAFVTRPESPAAVCVPAFASQSDMLNAQAVNFTRGALDQAQIIVTRQVQGNTVVIDAPGGFLAPACVGWLRGERNLHRFGHFICPY